jgi:thioredoxin 1
MSKSFSRLSDQELQSVAGGVVTLVEFFGPDCKYCVMNSAAVDAVAAAFGDQLDVVRIDPEQHPGLADYFGGVSALPTTMVLKDRKVVSEKVGAVTEAKLTDMVRQAV